MVELFTLAIKEIVIYANFLQVLKIVILIEIIYTSPQRT